MTRLSEAAGRAGIIAILACSMSFVLLAPLAMPDDYDWRVNFISESAAQGLKNAWIARMGFLLFGYAVIWLALTRRLTWGRWAYGFHMLFGMFMIATAAFSHKPWMAAVSYDAFEDLLHSVTATGMGFAFSFGVLMCLLQRKPGQLKTRVFDITAISIACILPVSASLWPQIAGLAQRIMFITAYLWYANEAMFRPSGSSKAGA